MEQSTERKTVFVALSGGVDSSVAALRLKEGGYDVIGVFIKVWHPDFLICDWEKERLDAMRVAATLDIPFLTFNAEDVYKKEVAQYFIKEYERGRTPNPDVMCNQSVKFGAFLRFAIQEGANFVATGHYAQTQESNGIYTLLRGIDKEKDQSYFLWTLREEQLSRILFPVGDATKAQVRVEAAAAGLPTAQKKDSQGICFLGKIDIQEFLSHYVKGEPGILLSEQGSRIGRHNGALFYTIGQRHGFTIEEKSAMQAPYYVIGKDMKTNIVTVSHTKPTLEGSALHLTECNWIPSPVKIGTRIEVQIRYRQTPVHAQLSRYSSDRAMLKVQGSIDAPARGQSCVVYKGKRCYGGGIIDDIT